ncbi:hypothetical protein ACFYXJ_25670 [Streptomyces sp. NPDC002667]|uniref:hypothetical protein n=1 Tax=Streptomyces sp. NPDC002667 TaxID=3364657 RepID=UPI0036C00E6D
MTTALANTRSRPVELHLSAGVVVLGPLGRVPCDAEDLDLGQVRYLCRTGVLTVRTESAARTGSESESGAESGAGSDPGADVVGASGKPARRPRKHG